MCESCCVTVCGLWSLSVGEKCWKRWHDGVCLAQRHWQSPHRGVDAGRPRSETYRCTSGRRRASGNLRCTRSDTSRECWRTSAGIPRWTPRTHSHLSSHRETKKIISSSEANGNKATGTTYRKTNKWLQMSFGVQCPRLCCDDACLHHFLFYFGVFPLLSFSPISC